MYQNVVGRDICTSSKSVMEGSAVNFVKSVNKIVVLEHYQYLNTLKKNRKLWLCLPVNFVIWVIAVLARKVRVWVELTVAMNIVSGTVVYSMAETNQNNPLLLSTLL